MAVDGETQRDGTSGTHVPSRTSVRFLSVGLVCLCVDLAVAQVAASAGAPLPLAGSVSHVAASGLAYLLHERWTFSTGRRFSAGRLLAVSAAYGVALIVRAACLWTTSDLLGFGDRHAVPQVLFAAGVALVFSFAAVRRILTGRRRTG